MSELMLVSGQVLTMSSREIAELVGKRHDNVKRTVETLVQHGIIQLPQFEEVKNHLGQTVTEYRIGKRDSYVVVAQLCPEFTARLVDRWQELEEKAAAKPIIPQTLPEALRLAADLAEQKAIVEVERDHAIAANAEMQPKVEALERISEADGAMCITNAAKSLQIRPKDLFGWLQQHRWVYRRAGSSAWSAYQDRIQQGQLEHKVTTVNRSDGSEKVVEQVLVTAKGLAKLAELIPTKPRLVA